MSTDVWIKISTYCARYDVSRSSVKTWVRDGRLRAKRVGLWWRVEDAPPLPKRRSNPEPVKRYLDRLT